MFGQRQAEKPREVVIHNHVVVQEDDAPRGQGPDPKFEPRVKGPRSDRRVVAIKCLARPVEARKETAEWHESIRPL